MNERLISETEFSLAVCAVDAVMGRDQLLSSDLAERAENFVTENRFFSGLVQVQRSGEEATLFRVNSNESAEK